MEDARSIFHSWTSKPEFPKYMSWVAHQSITETKSYLQHQIDAWQNSSDYEFVIELNAELGTPIGAIGMHELKPYSVGFGYLIAEEHWNKGYMSEALKYLVDWALAQDNIFRAQAFCDAENLASAKVMENAGMIFEGKLKKYFVHPNLSSEPRDSLMYAKTV